MKKLFFTICFAVIFFIQTAFACTLGVKPIGKFDETEYIFIGEVIGYATLVESAKLRQNAYGLIVRVKENVYLPKIPKIHFEIFPIRLMADCSLSGTPLEELRKEYPMNSELRVIAKEAEILPNNLSDGNIRLEERPGELGSIALNYDENKNRMSSVNSVFDYKSFDYDMDEDSDSKYLLPDFEIRKDLLRLKNSKTQKERTGILKRLLDVPICCNNLDFHTVFKTYTSNESEFNLLNEMRLRKELTKEEFEQYKAYNDTLSELVKLGYERNVAEKALGKALQEGTEMSKQKLLERSLQILPKINSK